MEIGKKVGKPKKKRMEIAKEDTKACDIWFRVKERWAE